MKIKFPQGTHYLVVGLAEDDFYKEFVGRRKEAELIADDFDTYFIMNQDGDLIDSRANWNDIDEAIQRLVMKGSLQFHQNLDDYVTRSHGEI